jgi:alpha-galactosidase
MRNIPVFHDLAEKAKRLCPNAWVFNFSNPLSVLTRVPHKCFGIKTIGMCHGVVGNAQRLVRLAGLDPKARLDYVTTGLDHVSWFTRLYADGVDVLARLKELGFCRSEGKMPRGGKDQDAFVGAIESAAANFAVWRELGYMSAISDRHAVETWPWFIVHESDEETYHVKRTTIAERQQNYVDGKARLERYIGGERNLFACVGHGNDPAIGVVEALCGFRTFEFTANYRNVGQIPGFPEDSVVETRCFFDRAGVHPLTSPMPDLLKAIVVPHALRQEASVDIALHGTFDDLVALVTTDPLCCRLPMGKCREMVREMILGTTEYIRNPRLLEF